MAESSSGLGEPREEVGIILGREDPLKKGMATHSSIHA